MQNLDQVHNQESHICPKCQENKLLTQNFWHKSKGQFVKSTCKECKNKKHYKRKTVDYDSNKLLHLCPKCNEEKPFTIEFFELRKDTNKLRENSCKKCDEKRKNKLYSENKEHFSNLNKKWVKENFDIRKEYLKEYYQENKQVIDKQKKEWTKNNREYNIEYQRNYRIENGRTTGTGQTIPEKQIEQFLIENNIKYIKEHSFNDCRGIKNGTLSFDFYLPETNTIVEFDGPHHFKPIFGVYNFKRQIEHDKRKSEYCQENNIRLIRIAYFENLNVRILEIPKV